MANPASASGNNGISGSTPGISGGNTAIRTSVAKTRKGYGSAVSASTVYSESAQLRFAYPNVECDSPERNRS